MLKKRLQWQLLLVMVSMLVLVFSLTGCGILARDDASPPEADEASETPAVDVSEELPEEQETPEVQSEEVAPDTSDLWAPAAHSGVGGNLPKKDDVPYPVYPGAQIHNHGWVGENQESNVIWMITTDPPDSVFAFYKEELAGWHSNQNGHMGFSLLWQGDAGDEEHACTLLIPAILISEPHEMQLEYMDEWLPGVQAEITVAYPAD